MANEARGESSEPLELRVTVGCSQREVDLIVNGSTANRVRDLAEAAADELGETAQLGLWCERRGEQLDADTPLRRCGIRWGDRLLLVPPNREPTRIGGKARVQLVMTGGPCAGESFDLGDGRYRLGRDPSLDICLTDPSLSRHHLDLLVEPTDVSVADAGSSNGTAVNGETLQPESFRALREGDELELGRTIIRFRSMRAVPDHGVAQRDGLLNFNRPPRVHAAIAPFSLELPPPPSRGRKTRLPLAASLVPLGAGLLLFVLLKSPIMLAIAGLSPLMAITTYLSDRRGGKRSFARDSAEFRAAVASALNELDSALADEATTRRAEAPDAPSLVEQLTDLSPTLWERRPEDSDFLCLRVGVADLPGRSSLTIQKGGELGLRAEVEEKLATRATVPSVPLLVDARKVGVVGLAGPRPASAGMARWLLLQAAILHSPGELVLMAAFSATSAQEWSWLKWLPHLRTDRIGLEAPPIAIGRGEAEKQLTEIRELVKQRGAQLRTAAGSGAQPVQLLLLLDEDTGVDRAAVTAALGDAPEQGVTVIWLGRDSRHLPGQTGAIIEIEEARAVLSLTDVATAEVIGNASAEGLPLDLADKAARLLAPLRDIGELARAGDIPRRVALLDLLELLPPTPEALQSRWEKWHGELRTTVGVSADGLLTLDIPTEGPHALIAGMTGSGKSEMLRTLVTAAAAAAPPHRLSFLLLDYKGGTALKPCATLPHVVDIVSDLDEHLAARALISLKAEMKRRERILVEAGAKDILELMRRDMDAAPPLLVIVFDEFAKLREELPEFVDGVVDITQRGRSLGVHVVLAAQTLGNSVTPAMGANFGLKVGLRVANESESEAIIASPLAHRIAGGEDSRGRAFLRTGHSELREFQTAYISGLSDNAQQRELRLTPFDLDAIASSWGQSSADSSDTDANSDLVALGEATREAQARMKLPVPFPPWLPMLPEVLALEDLSDGKRDPERVAVGLVDIPHLQRQDPLIVELKGTGHVVVFGAGNSGKTTTLTTTALALAHSTSPDRLRIYCLDAAGGRLAPLAGLPHCGGVVMVDEEERVSRLLRLLLRQVEQRGSGTDGEETLEGPLEAGKRTTVLLLDDLGSFAHQYERPGFDTPYEQLQQILAGGRGAGVHVILTASRRGALPAALAAHFGQRLVLRMPTEEDMLSLGLDAKTVRGARLPVGRGFTQDGQEFHIAVAARNGKITPIADAVSAVPDDGAVPVSAIGVLPAHVPRASLPVAVGLDRVPLGISDEHLAPAMVDLSDMHLLVVGPYRSGRSTALGTLAHGVRKAHGDAPMHLFAPRRSPLLELDIWTSTATGADHCSEAAVSLLERHTAGNIGGEPAFLFIDDGGELNAALIVSQLEQLVRSSRDSRLRILAAVESGAARGIGNSWIREMRREGHGVLLQPDLAADGDLLMARLPRRVAVRLLPGRGFLVAKGTAELIHVAA